LHLHRDVEAAIVADSPLFMQAEGVLPGVAALDFDRVERDATVAARGEVPRLDVLDVIATRSEILTYCRVLRGFRSNKSGLTKPTRYFSKHDTCP